MNVSDWNLEEDISYIKMKARKEYKDTLNLQNAIMIDVENLYKYSRIPLNTLYSRLSEICYKTTASQNASRNILIGILTGIVSGLIIGNFFNEYFVTAVIIAILLYIIYVAGTLIYLKQTIKQHLMARFLNQYEAKIISNKIQTEYGFDSSLIESAVNSFG